MNEQSKSHKGYTLSVVLSGLLNMHVTNTVMYTTHVLLPSEVYGIDIQRRVVFNCVQSVIGIHLALLQE